MRPLGNLLTSLTCLTDCPGTRKEVQGSVTRGRLQPDGTAGSVGCSLPGAVPAMPQTSSFAIKVSRKAFPQEALGAFSGNVCLCVSAHTVGQEPRPRARSPWSCGPWHWRDVGPGLGGGRRRGVAWTWALAYAMLRLLVNLTWTCTHMLRAHTQTHTCVH